jgi:hypothetical protein
VCEITSVKFIPQSTQIRLKSWICWTQFSKPCSATALTENDRPRSTTCNSAIAH